MQPKINIFYIFLLGTSVIALNSTTEPWPSVTVAVLVRNKELTLPSFLKLLLDIDYPKKQLSLWVYSDYNNDSSLKIIGDWYNKHSTQFKKFHLTQDRSTNGLKLIDQRQHSDWTPLRYNHVIKLREKAMEVAKEAWADYVFMLDADVFLTNPKTLKSLVKKNLSVVAPMLITDGLYSNFWADMTEEYYYKRSDNYEDIIHRKQIGCFNVPMVHSAVLISLKQNKSNLLTYDPAKVVNYDGPHDDIITFALSAKKHGVNMTVCNDKVYGFLPIPVEDDMETEAEQVNNVKLEALGRGIDIPVAPELAKYVKFPQKSKYNLDKVFLINLKRRTERKNLMMKSFEILGLDVKVVEAVDGTNLTKTNLEALSISLMPDYEDPYHKRPMKVGEIGCFLSHYNIWTEITQKNLGITLILEDDIHFASYFRERFFILMSELKNLDWDMVYIGRKVLTKDEDFVSEHVIKPHYSYWTLGYLIKEEGARKLINAEPLSKMLPVDEFLPIMFNQHPNEGWKNRFPNRDLKAYSASPLLVHPTHYTGEAGYVSDTEDSHILAPPHSEEPVALRLQTGGRKDWFVNPDLQNGFGSNTGEDDFVIEKKSALKTGKDGSVSDTEDSEDAEATVPKKYNPGVQLKESDEL